LRRVNVKGTSGSGKSTFGEELAKRLGVAYVELDALHHGPNWSEPTAEEFRAKVQAAMDAAPDGWVIDGNYESKLEDTVIGASDTIVWLDLPFWVKARRLLRRTAHRIRHDVELWSGNKENWRNVLIGRDALFWWMVKGHFRHRRRWPPRYEGDPRFVRLRSVDEAKQWLDRASTP
jgi:adenylate kinase family enzyme